MTERKKESAQLSRRAVVAAIAAAVLLGSAAVVGASAAAGGVSDIEPFAKLTDLLARDEARRPDTRVVATVNGEPITADQLVVGLLAADAGFVDPEGGAPPDADRLLEAPVRSALLRQEAERLGLAVSDAEVTALLKLAIVAPLRDPAVPKEMKELTEELLRRQGIDAERAADAPALRDAARGWLLRGRLLERWAAEGRSAEKALQELRARATIIVDEATLKEVLSELRSR